MIDKQWQFLMTLYKEMRSSLRELNRPERIYEFIHFYKKKLFIYEAEIREL